MSTEKSSHRQTGPEFLIYCFGALMLVAVSFFVFLVTVVICVCFCRYFHLPAICEVVSWIVAGVISLLVMTRLVRLERQRRFIERASSAIVRYFSRHEKKDA